MRFIHVKDSFKTLIRSSNVRTWRNTGRVPMSHITVKQRGQEPLARRCHADASLFTCPFCSSDVCKPRQYHQIMAHIAGHKLKAVEYGDYVIYSCNICCGKTARHFHCCQCPKTYINKAALKKHLCNSHPIACTLKPETVSDPLQDPPSQQPTSQPQPQQDLPSPQPTLQPQQDPPSQQSASPSQQPASQPQKDPPSQQPTSQPQQDPPSQLATSQSQPHQDLPSQQPTSQPQQDPPSQQPASQPQQDPPSQQPTFQPQQDLPSQQPTSLLQKDPPSQQPTSQPQQDPPSQQPTSQPQQDPPSQQPTSQPQQDPPSQQPKSLLQKDPPSQQPASQPQQDPPSQQPLSQPQQDPPSQQPLSQPLQLAAPPAIKRRQISVQCLRRHITVKQRGQEPLARRCHADASLFLCPFCSSDVCKPRQYHQIMAHIAGHKLRAVEYGDFVIYSCNICCGKTARHFHCCQCPKTYINKAAIKKHLCNSHPIACTLKPETVSDPLQDPPSQQPASQPQKDPPSQQTISQSQQDPPSQQPTSQSLQLAAPPAIKRRQISVQCLRRHITVKQRGQEPRARRCHADASLFLCPFCSSDVCKPRQYHQIMAHIAGHKLRAVEYGDFVIYSCNICCGKTARHFHCCQCPKTYINKAALKKHLCNSHPIACTLKPQPVSDPLQDPPSQQPASQAQPQQDLPSPQPTLQPQQDPPSQQSASQPQQDPPSQQSASQPQQDPPSQQPASQPQQDPPSQQPASQPQHDPPSQQPASQPQQDPPSQRPTSQPQEDPPLQQKKQSWITQHITITQRGQEPRARRCHADASLFLCPFCSSDVCKPRQYHQIMAHIAGHKLRAVEYGDHVIYSCNICCGKTARHFHCCQCPKTYINKAALKKHLCNIHPIACSLKPQTVSDPLQDPPSQQPTSPSQQDPPSQQPTSQPLQLAVPPAIKRRQISVQCRRRHITVKQRGQEPLPQRCHADASLFLCPFCSSDVCKPRKYKQIMAHIVGHKLRAVEYGGYVIYSCNSCGEKARHFHCCQCPQTYFNQGSLRRHLYSTHPIATGAPEPQPVDCALQEPPVQQPAPLPVELAAQPGIGQRKQISVQCPHCRVSLNSKNLKIHIKRKHHEAMHPITSPWDSSHKVICDMDICKSGVEMAPRSELLVTQCVSLSSVDYRYTCAAAHSEDLSEDMLTEPAQHEEALPLKLD